MKTEKDSARTREACALLQRVTPMSVTQSSHSPISDSFLVRLRRSTGNRKCEEVAVGLDSLDYSKEECQQSFYSKNDGRGRSVAYKASGNKCDICIDAGREGNSKHAPPASSCARFVLCTHDSVCKRPR